MDYHKFISDHEIGIQPSVLALIEDNVPPIEYLKQGLLLIGECHDQVNLISSGHHRANIGFDHE